MDSVGNVESQQKIEGAGKKKQLILRVENAGLKHRKDSGKGKEDRGRS